MLPMQMCLGEQQSRLMCFLLLDLFEFALHYHDHACGISKTTLPESGDKSPRSLPTILLRDTGFAACVLLYTRVRVTQASWLLLCQCEVLDNRD